MKRTEHERMLQLKKLGLTTKNENSNSKKLELMDKSKLGLHSIGQTNKTLKLLKEELDAYLGCSSEWKAANRLLKVN